MKGLIGRKCLETTVLIWYACSNRLLDASIIGEIDYWPAAPRPHCIRHNFLNAVV